MVGEGAAPPQSEQPLALGAKRLFQKYISLFGDLVLKVPVKVCFADSIRLRRCRIVAGCGDQGSRVGKARRREHRWEKCHTATQGCREQMLTHRSRSGWRRYPELLGR